MAEKKNLDAVKIAGPKKKAEGKPVHVKVIDKPQEEQHISVKVQTEKTPGKRVARPSMVYNPPEKSRVEDAVERAVSGTGTQAAASPEEKARREAQGKTQGRKGCKAARINMAFWADNYEYIQVMSKAKGLSLTDFVNTLIQERMQTDTKYERIRAILEE